MTLILNSTTIDKLIPFGKSYLFKFFSYFPGCIKYSYPSPISCLIIIGNSGKASLWHYTLRLPGLWGIISYTDTCGPFTNQFWLVCFGGFKECIHFAKETFALKDDVIWLSHVFQSSKICNEFVSVHAQCLFELICIYLFFSQNGASTTWNTSRAKCFLHREPLTHCVLLPGLVSSEVTVIGSVEKGAH